MIGAFLTLTLKDRGLQWPKVQVLPYASLRVDADVSYFLGSVDSSFNSEAEFKILEDKEYEEKLRARGAELKARTDANYPHAGAMPPAASNAPGDGPRNGPQQVPNAAKRARQRLEDFLTSMAGEANVQKH